MAVLAEDVFGQLNQLEQARQRAANAVDGDPNLPDRLSQYHSNYWWMDPGAIWSLAKAGIEPSDPAAQAAAVAAAHVEVNQGLAFRPVGSPVLKPTGSTDTADVFASLAKLEQTHFGSATPAPETAAGDGPLKQLAGDSWSNFTPAEQAQLNQVQFADTDPNVDYTKPGDLKIANWDQLDRNMREKTGDIIRAAIGADTKLGDNPESRLFISDQGYFDYNNGTFAAENHDWDKKTAYDVLAPLAPILRPGFAAASAPLQELQGQFRNLYELATQHDNPNWLQSQSDLGIAIGDVLHGRKVDLGNGIFVDPNSGVSQERERRLLERGTIGGHGITFGRAFADVQGLQPGSKPYQLLSGVLDAGFALKLDPTVKALKFGSEVRSANKLIASEGSVGAGIRTFKETGEITPAFQAFQDAGGITGIRPTTSKDAANKWLDGHLDELNALDNAPNAYSIWRASNRQMDPALAGAIKDNTQGAPGVANLVRDELGLSLRTKFDPNDALQVGRRVPSRWVSMMPGSEVDPTDLQANAVALERGVSLTRGSPEQMHSYFEDLARATSPIEVRNVWSRFMDDTEERLLGKGVGASEAHRLTRFGQASEATDRVYAATQVAEGKGQFGQQLVVDGTPAVITENQPTMLAQTLNGPIPLPNWRALRSGLSTLRPVLENELVQGGDQALNFLQGKVWKALQISTVKTMIKVLADEQFAMAARGYDSIMSHPVSALGMILATPLSELPEDAGFLARVRMATAKELRWGVESTGITPKLTSTVLGHDFETLTGMQTAASHGFDAAVDTRGVLHADDWKVLQQQPGVNDAEFLDAHGRHLAQYAASPEMRGFARASTLQEAQDAYWSGDLAKWREQFKASRPDLHLDDRASSDAFVAKAMNQMRNATNGNPDLIEAIASGRLDGSSIWNTVADGTPRVSKNFLNKLSGYQDDFPQVTPQQKSLYSADVARRQVADSIFGRAVHVLLGTPSAVLSKSPLFRQAYWERIIDNAPFMTTDAQAEVLRIAEGEANLPDKLVQELHDSITAGNRNRTPFSGTLNLERADQIAQGHGLDMVRRTTHEFSQRSQAFDMLRLLTPFGEVWRKTIQRWANIVNENPSTVRRLQQGVEAARGTDLGSFLGTPAGQGFFHTDQNGQEVFTIPGSEWATQALTGVPVPLVGNVKGLSLGTEFFPALGPVASIPVAWTMQKLHVENTDLGPLGTMSEALFPYGPPKNLGDIWNYAPSWMKNAWGANRPTSQDSVRTYNNTVIDYLRYGETNGDYDLSTAAGIKDAMEDASKKASTLYKIRGAAQFFVPGAPSPQMLVRDKSGKVIDAGLLVQDFKKLQDADPNTAGQKFLDQYGPDIFRAMTSKSYAYVFGIPTSADSARWVDEHSDVKTDAPHLFGYFAPPSDPDKFDYNVYLDQLQPGGGRVPLTPEQWTKAANARLAALQFGHYRDQVDTANSGKPPNADQRAWLANVKKNLMAEYPGYEDSLYGGSGLPDRPDPKLLVDEATRAVSNPTVRDTEAGQGLSSYLNVQSKVDEAWTAAGYAPGTWQTSSGDWAIALRGYMRQVGANIEQTHPLFGPLFDDVFDRAMRNDTDPNNLTPGG